MSTIFAMVKLYEQKEHAESFMNGKLFMNTVRYFKQYTDRNGELRGDSYEGISTIFQPHYIKEIIIGDLKIPSEELGGPILIHDENLLRKNAFCLYSLNNCGFENLTSEDISEFKRILELHKSCYGLGDICVVVLNTEKFKKRCIAAIKQKNLSAELSLVEYYDELNYHGDFPKEKLGFHKRSIFSHQKEYRIIIDAKQAEETHYILDIGDIHDITTILPTNEFNGKLEVKSK